jgi:hypothetical protein
MTKEQIADYLIGIVRPLAPEATSEMQNDIGHPE